MGNELVRTSKHEVKFANAGKQSDLCAFIDEYRRVADLILSDIWTNGYKWGHNGVNHEFNIQHNKLQFPSFIDYNNYSIATTLSARALSSLVTQLCGIIKAEVEKQRKRVYMLDKLKEEGTTKKQRALLVRKLKQNIPVKPNVAHINPELSSKCTEWIASEGHFGGFLRLRSIFRDKTEILIPIKYHKQSNKLMSKGIRMNSFLIGKHNVNVRWSIPKPNNKSSGVSVGADQGMKDILTLSDKQTTPKADKHGHTLHSVLETLSKRKRGSNAFKRSQTHRENFINWSINQLNIDNIQEIKLEDIWNIGYKSGKSRIMSHWTNTLIRDKVEKVCEENGVRLTRMSPTYRSQRCSCCGVVRKANRKGKIYSCKLCGYEADADYNASLNLAIDLPEIPYVLRKKNMNRGNGFIWNEAGFFDFSGRHLEFLPPVEPIDAI